MKWSIVSISVAILLWIGVTVLSVYNRGAAIESVQSNFDCSNKVEGGVLLHDLFARAMGLPARLDNVTLSGRKHENDYAENVEEAILAAGHVEVLCLISPTNREMDLARIFPSVNNVRVFSINQSREIFELDWLRGLHCNSLYLRTDRSVTAVPRIDSMHSLGFDTCSELDKQALARTLESNPQLNKLYVVNCQEIDDTFLEQLKSTYPKLAIKTELNDKG